MTTKNVTHVTRHEASSHKEPQWRINVLSGLIIQSV